MNTKDLNLKVTGYCKHWNEWEAVREIATNARDVHPRAWGISHDKTERTLTIWNSGGKVLMPHHFIMGEHQVQNKDASVIGKFGEGLKVAITVLLRLGYDLEIASGNYRYYPAKDYPYRDDDSNDGSDSIDSIDSINSNDVNNIVDEIAKQFKEGTFDAVDEEADILAYVQNIATAVIYWEEVPLAHIGTQIVIRNWRLNTDFKERFLEANNTKVVFTDEHGRQVLRESPPNLYVGDVYVCEMPNYYRKQWAFGYNLTPDGVHLNRDRNVADYWQVNSDIARVWSKVDDDSLWELFFIAQQTNALEGQISLQHYMRFREAKESMAKGFQRLHGDDAVISTDHQFSAYAESDGKQIVDVSTPIKEILEHYIDTDESYVMDVHKTSNAPILNDELNRAMKANLRMMKSRSKKITDSLARHLITWHPFVFDDDAVRAKANIKKNFVYVNIDILRNRKESLSVLVEELAHVVYGTSDNTRAHVIACCDIAADLLLI